MRIIHLIVGDVAAKPLMEACAEHEAMSGEVVVLKDILHVGPLKTEGLGFSEGRSLFWNTVAENQSNIQVDDLERYGSGWHLRLPMLQLISGYCIF
jgi:hypothetical protein